MIHFLPDDASNAPGWDRRDQFRDGLAHALAVVEQISGENSGPPRLLPAPGEPVGAERAEMLDDLARRITAASAAGLEAIAALSDEGLEANPAAARLLADTLRDGLESIER